MSSLHYVTNDRTGVWLVVFAQNNQSKTVLQTTARPSKSPVVHSDGIGGETGMFLLRPGESEPDFLSEFPDAERVVATLPQSDQIREGLPVTRPQSRNFPEPDFWPVAIGFISTKYPVCRAVGNYLGEPRIDEGAGEIKRCCS
jgi:hypothetical protein